MGSITCCAFLCWGHQANVIRERRSFLQITWPQTMQRFSMLNCTWMQIGSQCNSHRRTHDTWASCIELFTQLHSEVAEASKYSLREPCFKNCCPILHCSAQLKIITIRLFVGTVHFDMIISIGHRWKWHTFNIMIVCFFCNYLEQNVLQSPLK